jgi:hypothetical protein
MRPVRIIGTSCGQVTHANCYSMFRRHMKCIVDDILTISKLDSGLLAITPIDAEPHAVVSHAVKMFESEAKAADVAMMLDVDQSYQDLKLDRVSLDPTRLLQVSCEPCSYRCRLWNRFL